MLYTQALASTADYIKIHRLNVLFVLSITIVGIYFLENELQLRHISTQSKLHSICVNDGTVQGADSDDIDFNSN